jgi:hypothetical protein
VGNLTPICFRQQATSSVSEKRMNMLIVKMELFTIVTFCGGSMVWAFDGGFLPYSHSIVLVVLARSISLC